ncbi:sugar transferase [Nodosilinea sp. LEGE 07298]|uniref:sugar transferase n=1 Tax=Nodosilinea sp. LEGE 07298 TaxID=2777970 RepID=UPI0018820D1F|nr:sugar transferase [Nodosilinea sp. LEGE 07298]MBE9112166.1 sugar transferase [Nodosilinea sp. LEGE 07298]
MFHLPFSSFKTELSVLEKDLIVPESIYSSPTHPSVTSFLKRCFDLVGGLIGLLVTLVLLVPIAIAIQLDNPGPIFYSQIRCGYRGQPFRIWKYRSMVVNADDLKHQVTNQAQGLIFKNHDDPRVTRVGRFLRRTSLDEFPQFWNVLRGDMSLVGTRPPTWEEVSQYEPHHWQRLNVKPGLTGKWQAQGRSSVKDFETIVKMDLDYQAHWSLRHDVHLILQTIGAVVLSRGAC